METNREELKSILRELIREDLPVGHTPLGERWIGGKMYLQPRDSNAIPKEIPVDTFFHKIVMVRDRLRVMEQAINAHKKLTDEEKVNLQQYITRIYGSLTTFNVLFREKDDYFVGQGSEKD